MPSPAIEVRNLSFAYDKELVLQNIDLTIYEGEYIAIIGPNGGGKSTFLKLLVGLLEPTEGQVLVYGRPASRMRHIFGYLPQNINFNLDIPLLAREVILQGRLQSFKFRYTQEDIQKVEEVAKRLGIEELLERKIGTLSGGQRQRVLLARALVSEPKILILDEPTASVDIKAQKEIYRLLQELGITKIVVSHDINIILEGVHKVLYINRTLIVHDNPTLHIHKENEGHFCEMELFEELAKRCDHG